ncbi:hypothetical protein [Jiella sp. M17.18]|uniref:hypothetical protein n=1 Tax=Jiella sp. M17.18 TaxID=3234247 RepID=UPI0034DE98AA
MTKSPSNDHHRPTSGPEKTPIPLRGAAKAPKTPHPALSSALRSAHGRPLVTDDRLTELARSVGARRHGETRSDSGTLPLPDAALVVSLAIQSVKQIGRVPMPIRDALSRLAVSGEPTSQVVLDWLARRGQGRSMPGRGAR